jgi:two-component system, NarL family, nitrate/nitrite response regulator NarL
MNGVLFVGSQLSREGLTGLLAGSGFSLIGEAGTLAEVHRWLCEAHAEGQRPQILLMYPEGRLGGDEEAMLRAIHRDQPAVKVIILGDAGSLGLLSQACPTEIDGYLLKDMSAAALMHSLHLIVSGQRIFPPGLHAAIPGPRATPEASISTHATSGLSPREAQILQLLIADSSNKTIARDLTISHETVKVHMKALLRKLNARNRTQAALWGIEHGVRQVGPPRLDGRQSPKLSEPHFSLARGGGVSQ